MAGVSTRTLVFAALLSVAPAPATAAVITLDAVERGFITQSGATNPTGSSIPVSQSDYLLGNCTFPTSCVDSGGGEYRDFFRFAIPTLGNVLSVVLQISTVGVDLAQSPSLTATFTSLLSPISFAALGTGTVYGATTYGATDANTLRSIALNPSAIAAILAAQGNSFLIGDRATSATFFDPAAPDQLVYVHSGHPTDLTRLVITTSEVPEPTTLALLGVAMAALSLRRPAASKTKQTRPA